MSDAKKTTEFFLGANTPIGFVSLFDQLTKQQSDWRCFVIKGGPGCGKSTLMRKAAQAFEGRYKNTQYILCSSDMDSLDALIIPELKAAIVDGTPPHSIELQYPGAVETIVDMGRCWQDSILYAQRKEIISEFEKNKQQNKQATVFLSIAGTLLDINTGIAKNCSNIEKVNRLSAKICRDELPIKRGQKLPGTTAKRFISGIAGDGQHLLSGTISALATRIYLLEDNYSVFAPTMLTKIHSQAVQQGYDAIACYCPMHPTDKLEHLFIPELSLAFVTANHFHIPDVNPCKVINSRRFTSPAGLKAHKKSLLHNRSTAKYMLEIACSFLAEAKLTHNKLEDYYNGAMNFEESTAIATKVIDSLENIALDL